jgi:hypothetical protein
MAAKLGSISLDQSPSKLYTKTAPSSLQDINVFVQLEKRVAAMESLLGPSTNTISKDTSSTTSLVNTIELLEQKVSTMDTSALDALRAKASSLKADLDNMNKGLPGTKATKGKVSGGADAMGASEIRLLDAAAQLVEVREGLASVQPVADDLPSVIQVSKKDTHSIVYVCIHKYIPRYVHRYAHSHIPVHVCQLNEHDNELTFSKRNFFCHFSD